MVASTLLGKRIWNRVGFPGEDASGLAVFRPAVRGRVSGVARGPEIA